MTNDRIWILLGKRASGDMNAAEKAELEQLLQADPDAAKAQGLIEAIWGTPLQQVDAPKGAPERIWEHVSGEIKTAGEREGYAGLEAHASSAGTEIRAGGTGAETHTGNTGAEKRADNTGAETYAGNTEADKRASGTVIRPLRVLFPAAAAAIVLALAWAGWRFTQHQGKPAKHHHLCSAPAGKSRITLPDGTQVWLNSNSRLTYDEHSFGRKNRELALDGEAFFDVAQNGEHPFIIHAGKVDIRVLGTAFNVKAYTTDSMVATTLIRGKIAVSFREQTLVLQPEEKLTIPLTTITPVIRQHLQKDSSGAIADISWMHSKLVFDNNTFTELGTKMKDWYGVTIHFESNDVAQLRFTGIIDTEQIDEALKTLQLSRPFHYRINGKEVWISN